MSENEIRLIYCTTSKSAEAREIGEKLVTEKLAACINIFPSIESIYMWQGKVERSEEASMIIKTTSAKVNACRKRVEELHSYDVPCLCEIKVGEINQKYEEWLNSSL